jgi:hypothetical protein
MEGTSDVGQWRSDGSANERIDEDGEEKAGVIGALDEDGEEQAGVIGALITNRRRWRWRWSRSRERHVMEV